MNKLMLSFFAIKTSEKKVKFIKIINYENKYRTLNNGVQEQNASLPFNQNISSTDNEIKFMLHRKIQSLL